jgi:hypothetical protein
MSEGRLYEHVAAMYRWLLATLFAANGGAMLALLGHEKNLPGELYALGWFALGVISSLLMGTASAVFGLRASTAITKARVMVEEGLLTGIPAKQEILELLVSQKPTWKTWTPSYLGGASLLFFIIGLGTIAGSLARTI